MGLYKRNNVWYTDYYCNGKRIRERSGSNKFLAQKMLSDRQTAILEGRHEIKRSKKVLFEDMAKDYIERYAKLNKKSFARDEQSLKRLIPFFRGKYLYNIMPLMIEDYKAMRRNEGVCVATINRELACLKTIFTKAIEWDKTSENPVKKVKLFKENNQRVRYLERGEIQALLKVSLPLLKTIIIVALNTGMRQGEILKLTWDDIDFDKGIIRVRNTKNSEKRFVPMNTSLINTLENYKETCNMDSPYVFCYNNKPLTRFGIIKGEFKRAVKEAGIKDFRFHDLRHTFASHLVMSGADIMTVQRLLGHKTLAMTLRYSHLSPNFMRSTVEQLSNKMVTNWSQTAKEQDTKKNLKGSKITI